MMAKMKMRVRTDERTATMLRRTARQVWTVLCGTVITAAHTFAVRRPGSNKGKEIAARKREALASGNNGNAGGQKPRYGTHDSPPFGPPPQEKEEGQEEGSEEEQEDDDNLSE